MNVGERLKERWGGSNSSEPRGTIVNALTYYVYMYNVVCIYKLYIHVYVQCSMHLRLVADTLSGWSNDIHRHLPHTHCTLDQTDIRLYYSTCIPLP